MKFYFANKELEKLYESGKSKKYSREVINAFQRRIKLIESVKNENELRIVGGNHFEKLKGKNKNYTIRLNKQFRIEFTFTKEGIIKIVLIQKISKHYE